jgi:hypothetical protein
MDLNANCHSRTQGSEDSVDGRAEMDRVSNSRGQGESLLIFFPRPLVLGKRAGLNTALHGWYGVTKSRVCRVVNARIGGGGQLPTSMRFLQPKADRDCELSVPRVHYALAWIQKSGDLQTSREVRRFEIILDHCELYLRVTTGEWLQVERYRK